MTSLRLDRFLFFARLAKSRTVAQRFIHDGHIRIDGTRADICSLAVKPGHRLTLTMNDRLRVLLVEALPARRGPASEAAHCYTEIVAPQPIDAARDRL
jgi:ribosome-associated heat shock protein Hsp15